jgi:hypothetical protein
MAIFERRNTMKKFLSLALFGVTLASSVMSLHALNIKPKSSLVCGGGCTIRPHTLCGGGCFCDTSLGDGMNQGICAAI